MKKLSAFSDQPSAISCQPSAGSHQLAAISRQPSAISRQLKAESRKLRAERVQSGAISIFTFVVMLALAAIVVSFLYMISIRTKSSGLNLASARAFWLAEAGRAKARWALTSGGESVGWAASDVPLGGGTYSVTSFYSGSNCTIISDGYIPDDINPVARSRVVESNIPFNSASTNLSLSATASASSESGGHPAGDAIDGNSHSKWAASDKDDAWFKLDFGGSTTFRQIIYDGNNINSCTIYYSSNDVSYVAVSNAVESPAGTVNFDPVTARYLRFDMDVDSNKKAELSEIETYNTTPGLGRGIFSTWW